MVGVQQILGGQRGRPFWGEPLTETQRHGEKFLLGTPTSSSASSPLRDDYTETPHYPIPQTTVPFLPLDGFKRLISVIKYQEFMPDPSDDDAKASEVMRPSGTFNRILATI